MISISLAAQQFLQQHRQQKIVFTNGCFDILHRGHILYLQEARSLGDLLFIGLNADASVRRLKGPERPINSEADRKLLLEALRCVDFVEIFQEDTPLNLIQAVCPQVLVKGGDWAVEKIVGAQVVRENGGEVRSIAFQQGYSSSSIIEQIRQL